MISSSTDGSELVCDTERPLHWMEKVAEVIKRWSTWPEEFRHGVHLCVKQNYVYINVNNAVSSTPRFTVLPSSSCAVVVSVSGLVECCSNKANETLSSVLYIFSVKVARFLFIFDHCWTLC